MSSSNGGQEHLPISVDLKESRFYFIKAKDEKGIRWEDNCKKCKSELRKKRKQKKVTDKYKKNKKSFVALQELQNSDGKESRKQELDMLSNDNVFSILEKNQNVKLNEKDKEESINNFNKFITLLRKEYGRELGLFVYVKN